VVQFLEGKGCSRLGEVKESGAAKPSKGCGGGPKVGGEGCGGGSAILGGVPALSLPTVASYENWTVREHQNQKYAYGHRALILSILLANSYR